MEKLFYEDQEDLEDKTEMKHGKAEIGTNLTTLVTSHVLYSTYQLVIDCQSNLVVTRLPSNK